MTFKKDSDDIRDSLSFKLRKCLEFYGANVLCSDEFYNSDEFVSAQYLVDNSDIIIIGTPHSVYDQIDIPKEIHVVNLWQDKGV